jgi:SAM-dependent methyltransferase
MTTAGLGTGSTVLEIGCGPGQLTERLARHGFDVTAVDIGPSMVAAARRRLAGSAVSFQVTSFEDFDDPLGAALSRMWAERTGDDAARTRRRPADAEIIAGSGLFEAPVERTDAQRTVLPAETVIGLENTRGIVLSWPVDVRRSFTDELRHYLASQPEVHLTQLTSLTMARVRTHLRSFMPTRADAHPPLW